MPSVKTAISMDRELLERIDEVARELDAPRSQVLAEAARQFLRRRESRRILEALDRSYADDETDESERELRRRKHRQLVEGEW